MIKQGYDRYVIATQQWWADDDDSELAVLGDGRTLKAAAERAALRVLRARGLPGSHAFDNSGELPGYHVYDNRSGELLGALQVDWDKNGQPVYWTGWPSSKLLLHLQAMRSPSRMAAPLKHRRDRPSRLRDTCREWWPCEVARLRNEVGMTRNLQAQHERQKSRSLNQLRAVWRHIRATSPKSGSAEWYAHRVMDALLGFSDAGELEEPHLYD